MDISVTAIVCGDMFVLIVTKILVTSAMLANDIVMDTAVTAKP